MTHIYTHANTNFPYYLTNKRDKTNLTLNITKFETHERLTYSISYFLVWCERKPTVDRFSLFIKLLKLKTFMSTFFNVNDKKGTVKLNNYHIFILISFFL